MSDAELDNPFWSSLCGVHRVLALRIGEVARFPAEFAPFLGVPGADVDASSVLDELIAPDESVCLIGPVPRTMELGRYFGIYQDGRLAAIIGERMGTNTTREISAICTHPDFLGRGYARRLTAMLTNATLAEGRLPFLHVSYENPRAKSLYDKMGYRVRRDVAFCSLRREATSG